MSVLINLPDYKHLHGGVASFYIGLRPFWSNNVKYNIVGKRRQRLPGILWLPADIVRFIWRTLKDNPKGIVVNPSFNRSAWIRDRIFIKIASWLHKPLIVMFHGWSESYVDTINSRALKNQFSDVNRVLVLANRFKKQLKDKDINVPIDFFTTHFSDTLLNVKKIKPRNNLPRRFLFMSRVEKTKGIYETIELFRLIHRNCPDASLTIAGDGSELENVKKYVLENSVDAVKFVGFVEGNEKTQILGDNDFFLLPSYNEGLPGALIEAMAAGLPVLTRPVGAIPDFFIDGTMGIMTESLDPMVMMERIRPFLFDRVLEYKVSQYNIQYAFDNFSASKVALRLESIFKETFN